MRAWRYLSSDERSEVLDLDLVADLLPDPAKVGDELHRIELAHLFRLDVLEAHGVQTGAGQLGVVAGVEEGAAAVLGKREDLARHVARDEVAHLAVDGGAVDAAAHRPAVDVLVDRGAVDEGAVVDQDINCRTVGRCVYGAPIDREVGDLIPRDVAGQVLPLSQDSGRAFLYARYNAELTRAGLDAMGLQDVKPEQVSKLDSVQFIPDLRRVGQKVGDEVKIEHFGTFV